MELSSKNAFSAIFPRYSQVLIQTTIDQNKDYQSFVTVQLPAKVQLVRNIQNTFLNFQNQYNNLILKRPSYGNLMHSLLLKVTDRTQRYFNSLGLRIQKSDNNQLIKEYQHVNFPQIRKRFRDKLHSIQDQLRQKYFSNHQMQKRCQQETTKRLYNLFQIYHFTKSDLISASSKFQFNQGQVIDIINSSNPTNNQILNGHIIKLSPQFKQYLYTIVNKRCRPFINKKDFLLNKMKQILKDSQSRLGLNFHMFLDSIIRKQKTRVNKQYYNDLMKQLKMITLTQSNQNNSQNYIQAKDIIKEVDDIKRSFTILKNNSYYFDIQRGTFAQKYKIDMNKLQNLYYLANLQKYLQNVSEFMDNLLRLQERVIQNSKAYMKDYINQIQEVVTQLKDKYYLKYQNCINIQDLIQQEFKALENSLYGNIPEQSPQDDYERKKEADLNARQRRKLQAEKRKQQLQRQRAQRQQKRRQDAQRRAQQDRQKRQQQKIKMQQRKKQQDQKYKRLKQQRQQKQKQRKEEQQLKKQQMEQQKRQKDQQARQKFQQKKKKDDQERIRLQQIRKKKQLQDKKKKQQELERKREEEKRKLQEKRQLQIKKKQEQDSRKQQEKQKKLQQQKELAQKKRKEEQDKQIKRKQDQRLKQQKLQKQKAEKQKRDQQKRDKQQKQRQQKEQQRIQKEQRQTEQKQRKRLQQLKKKQQQQKIAAQKAEKEKKKREEQQQSRRKKQEADRIQRQRIAEQKRKQQQRQKQKRKQQQKKRQEQKRQQLQRIATQKKKKEEQQKLQRQRKRKEEQEKAEKEKKRLLQQKLKEQQQKRKTDQKRKQQQKKKEDQRKKELQLQKIAQQNKRKQQQVKKAALNTKGSGKKVPAKSSGIDYTDFDDIIDDDLDQIENSQQKKNQPQKPAQQPKKQQDQFDNYQDDFDEQSPEKQQQQIQTKSLINSQNIKFLNDYIKGTQYARKNKPNLEAFNNTKQYIYIFEEMIENNKIFIFKPEVSHAMIDFGKQLSNQNANEDDLRMTVQTIRDAVFDAYQNAKETRDIDPRAKLVFPFSFENPFGIKIVQVLIYSNTFQVVFQKALPQDQKIQSDYMNFIQGFLHIFEMQGQPQVSPYVLQQQTALVISTVDKQLPCLLILFAMHYEQIFNGKILINQYTIERFFYASHVLQPFYSIFSSQEQSQTLSQFYQKLYQKCTQNEKKIKISLIQIQANQDYDQAFAMNSHVLKQQFLKTSDIQQSHLVMFQLIVPAQNQEQQQIQEGEYEKITLFMQMTRQKSPNKNLLNYYIISKDQVQQQNNSKLFEFVSSQIDDQFESNIYIDYTRHNGLSQYSDWCLPLWSHIMTKRKMSAINAFRTMAFALTPFYVAFKQMD